MIATSSQPLSNTPYTSNESLPSRSRRPTLESLASLLTDSTKQLLDQIPHHQQKLVRFRKRAKSLLATSLVDQFSFDRKTSDSVGI